MQVFHELFEGFVSKNFIDLKGYFFRSLLKLGEDDWEVQDEWPSREEKTGRIRESIENIKKQCKDLVGFR